MWLWSILLVYENICDERLLVFLGGAGVSTGFPSASNRRGRNKIQYHTPGTKGAAMIDAAVSFPFTVRKRSPYRHDSSRSGGVHGGQIAFPGGKHDVE